MLYLIVFAIVTGAIASFIFFTIYKKHIKKYETIKEKSFLVNAPKIFGTINCIISLVFGIWYSMNPSAFSENQTIDSTVVYILMTIFFIYFHILALPLSIGSVTLTLLLKKNISKIRFLYYILTNIIASILLFVLTYLILNK